MNTRIFGTMLGMMVFSSVAVAQDVPQSVAVQGVLTDAADVPVTDNVAITFRIYDDANTPIFSQTIPVDVENGFFSVNVGDATTPVDHTIFRDNSAPTLGIQIGSSDELSPRLEFKTVPYASHSAFANFAWEAETLGGFTAGQFASEFVNLGEANVIATAMLQDGAVTGAKIADGSITNADLRNPQQVYRVTNVYCEQEPGTLMTSSTCRATQRNVETCPACPSAQPVEVRDCNGQCACTLFSLCIVGQPCDFRASHPQCANAPAGYIVP